MQAEFSTEQRKSRALPRSVWRFSGPGRLGLNFSPDDSIETEEDDADDNSDQKNNDDQ